MILILDTLKVIEKLKNNQLLGNDTSIRKPNSLTDTLTIEQPKDREQAII